MTVIDEHGRLFGRYNLIDAAAAVFVLALVPVAYAAYAVFRVPPPTITSVEPATIQESKTPTVGIRGTNFMPYLTAFVSPAGEPLPRYLPSRAQSEAVFLLESPFAAVLELPELSAGTYDIYLFDEATELTRFPNALTVTPPPPPSPDVPSDRTVATARIRMHLPADIGAMPAPGDVDRYGSPTASGEPDATILATARQRMPNPNPGINDYVILVMDLRVPVSRMESGLWAYKGQRVRVGESIVFGTADYHVQGLVIHADIPEGVPWNAGHE